MITMANILFYGKTDSPHRVPRFHRLCKKILLDIERPCWQPGLPDSSGNRNQEPVFLWFPYYSLFEEKKEEGSVFDIFFGSSISASVT